MSLIQTELAFISMLRKSVRVLPSFLLERGKEVPGPLFFTRHERHQSHMRARLIAVVTLRWFLASSRHNDEEGFSIVRFNG